MIEDQSQSLKKRDFSIFYPKRTNVPEKSYEIPENVDEILEITSNLKKRIDISVESLLFKDVEQNLNNLSLFGENIEETLILKEREEYINYVCSNISLYLPEELQTKQNFKNCLKAKKRKIKKSKEVIKEGDNEKNVEENQNNYNHLIKYYAKISKKN